MSRLLRFVLLLWLFFIMLQLTTRLVGRIRPLSPLAQVMTGSDGEVCDHPCLFGIRPGVTRIEQAVENLKSHPLTHDAIWQNGTTLRLAGPEGYVALSQTTEGLVDSLSLTDNLLDTGVPIPDSLVDSVTLAEVIGAFGRPNVSLPGSDYFVLEFPFGITAANALPNDFQTRINANTALSILMISIYRACSQRRNESLSHRWIGYATLRQYFDDPVRISSAGRLSGVPVPPFTPCQK